MVPEGITRRRGFSGAGATVGLRLWRCEVRSRAHQRETGANSFLRWEAERGVRDGCGGTRPRTTGSREIREQETVSAAVRGDPHTRRQKMSLAPRRLREGRPRRSTSGPRAHCPISADLAQSESHPGRPNGISTLSFGGLGPPTPSPAPPRDGLDKDLRLARGMSANSGWLKRSHEGTVVAFPEAITGQAQSFASVSGSSW